MTTRRCYSESQTLSPLGTTSNQQYAFSETENMKAVIASLALLFCMTNATLCAPDDAANATVAFDTVVQPAEAKVVLEAPSVCRIGELVRLDVSESTADSFKWLLVPDSVDWLTYEDGARAVFSARTAGEYRFIIACAKGGTVDAVTHIIRCLGPPARPEDGNLAGLIPFWMWSYELPQEEVNALATSFEEIATRKAEFEDSGDWIKATATANREVLGGNLDAWKPMLDKIGAELVRRAESGALSTPEDHAQVWLEVAEGLRNS